MSSPTGERGAVYPSYVVMLSIIALFMAGVAFVVTGDREPTEREVVTVAAPEPSPTSEATEEPEKKQKPKKPAVDRGAVFVEVYNNSNISGLAGGVGEKATGAGWQVVGTDNWVGTIPANTVYYPKRLERAAKLLALDLGVERLMPAVDPMKRDRLTVILTGELA